MKVFRYVDGITISGREQFGLGSERGTCALYPDEQEELVRKFLEFDPQMVIRAVCNGCINKKIAFQHSGDKR